MGKFDKREKAGGNCSFESKMSSSNKIGFKSKKHVKTVPYFSDPLIIPRINQYLADNKDKVYVDINDMADDLQSRYKEYARRKKNAFKQLVEKAFAVVLQQCGLNQGGYSQGDCSYIESTENSSSEVEECNISDSEDKCVSSSNNQLLNLYKPSQLQAMAKQYQRCPNENAELIDLSSDDDSGKKNDDEIEKETNETRTNGLQNHVFSKETTVTLVKGNNSKGGIRFPIKGSERPPVTIVRKRKLGSSADKSSSKKRKESIIQDSPVTFADFAGNDKVLEEICKLVLHIQHPELFRRIGVSSPRGFLLHGPPGCGKTLLATAIAGELQVPFLKVAAPELVGGVSGESEERIRDLFSRAAESAPCVLFIDEVDAVTPHRQNAQREMERRIVAQLLTCLDELSEKPNGDQVLVIGATNRPDALDPALRRAGRFDREVCLGIPDCKAREKILRVLCSKLRVSENFSYEEAAQNTPGFVGADLLALTREASMAAINRVFGALQRRPKERSKSDDKKPKTSGCGVDRSSQTCDPPVVPSVPSTSAEANENEKNETVVAKNDNRDDDKMDSSESPDDKDGDDRNGKKTDEGNDAILKENVDAMLEENVGAGKPKETDKVDEKGSREEEKKDCETVDVQKADDNSKTKDKDKDKDKDNSPGKYDSDMDIAETISEESINGESKDIEVCKENFRTGDDGSESDIEIIPEDFDSVPPTLDTLLSWIRDSPPLTNRQLKNLCVTKDDFKKALKCVQPSAKREGFVTVPDVTWDDVGSLADVREELKMSILGPVKFRKQFEQLGLEKPAGILICGPPGCGKTLLAKAIANEAGINFISVKGPELLNMYVGESERAVRQCFQRARNSAPCVIFFDELDALCPRRSDSGENAATMRVVNQMLTEMDGMEDRKEVFLLAATNRPDIVDPAVLRPGRLDKILYVGLPRADDRIDILKKLTKNGTRPKLAEDVNLIEIANRSECNGYSGADLAALVRQAGIQALKKLLEDPEADPNADLAISSSNFEEALKLIKPSVSSQDQKHYESLKKRFSSSNLA